jgi:hypothetical protein
MREGLPGKCLGGVPPSNETKYWGMKTMFLKNIYLCRKVHITLKSNQDRKQYTQITPPKRK